MNKPNKSLKKIDKNLREKINMINSINKLLLEYKGNHKITVKSYIRELKGCTEELRQLLYEYKGDLKNMRYKNAMTMNRFYTWAKRELKKCNNITTNTHIEDWEKIKENAYKIFKTLK